MDQEETVERAEVIDPELKVRLEKDAMNADRKRTREICEIAGRHQISHAMVNKVIYGDCVTVADLRGIVLDYRENQDSATAVTVLEDTGMKLTEKEVQPFSNAKLLRVEINLHDEQAQVDGS